MSALSIGSFQSFGSWLSGQSSGSALSWQSDGAVLSRRTYAPPASLLPRAALAVTATAVTGLAWWQIRRALR